jgi:hypothetical protein
MARRLFIGPRREGDPGPAPLAPRRRREFGILNNTGRTDTTDATRRTARIGGRTITYDVRDRYTGAALQAALVGGGRMTIGSYSG